MSQDYAATTEDDSVLAVGYEIIPGCLEALRSRFSGATEPANPIALQSWFDTTLGLDKIRNLANGAWLVSGLSVTMFELGSLSASRNIFLGTSYRKQWVLGCRILSDTSSSGSGAGQRWDFQIRNLTAAVNLLAAAKTTNGAEISANVPYDVLADQNQTPAVNAALELQITKTGAATTLTRCSVEFLTCYAPAA